MISIHSFIYLKKEDLSIKILFFPPQPGETEHKTVEEQDAEVEEVDQQTVSFRFIYKSAKFSGFIQSIYYLVLFLFRWKLTSLTRLRTEELNLRYN